MASSAHEQLELIAEREHYESGYYLDGWFRRLATLADGEVECEDLDRSETCCHACATRNQKEMLTRPADNFVEVRLVASRGKQEDKPLHCSDCGEPLDYSPTDECAGQILEGFLSAREQADLPDLTPRLAFDLLQAIKLFQYGSEEQRALVSQVLLEVTVLLQGVVATGPERRARLA